jgi:hypothetical protein
MNIYLVIFLPLVIYMFYDFSKAFLTFSFLKIFLNQNINLVNIPGVPLLTIELFVNICFALYFFKNRKRLETPEKFPLKVGYIFVLVSTCVSTVFSIIPINSAITRTLQEIVNTLIFPYILWNVVRTRKDVVYLLNGLLFVFIMLGLYGLFEKLTNTNPIYNYNVSLNAGGTVADYTYADGERLGLGRVRSAIIHPIGFGTYLAVYISLILYLTIKYREVWKTSIIFKGVAFLLCILCLFFTNSRSPLIFLAIGIIPAIDLKKIITYRMAFLLLVMFVASYSYISAYFANIESLVGIHTAGQKIGGSDMAMRISQFNAAFNIAGSNLFTGMGVKSISLYLGNSTGLLGAESVWLFLIVERGFLGVFAHIILLICIFRMNNKKSRKFVHFITIGWLILTSITSTPGVDIGFFISIIIIANRVALVADEKIFWFQLPDKKARIDPEPAE